MSRGLLACIAVDRAHIDEAEQEASQKRIAGAGGVLNVHLEHRHVAAHVLPVVQTPARAMLSEQLQVGSEKRRAVPGVITASLAQHEASLQCSSGQAAAAGISRAHLKA